MKEKIQATIIDFQSEALDAYVIMDGLNKESQYYRNQKAKAEAFVKCANVLKDALVAYEKTGDNNVIAQAIRQTSN